ncbi:hypothetical protein TNIN_130851 [Trichonephila inaurata madagascariensis]|uniref:Uncharacterized protein n=1 Tax=Trichonephila inaurata madagascariensis TaxID=2747483 RepID=A0A8X6KFY9_9ARAC|nr:hypothetical protein TNIN_130851 [Trichonephila inaurata madagascariensis]
MFAMLLPFSHLVDYSIAVRYCSKFLEFVEYSLEAILWSNCCQPLVPACDQRFILSSYKGPSDPILLFDLATPTPASSSSVTRGRSSAFSVL